MDFTFHFFLFIHKSLRMDLQLLEIVLGFNVIGLSRSLASDGNKIKYIFEFQRISCFQKHNKIVGRIQDLYTIYTLYQDKAGYEHTLLTEEEEVHFQRFLKANDPLYIIHHVIYRGSSHAIQILHDIANKKLCGRSIDQQHLTVCMRKELHQRRIISLPLLILQHMYVRSQSTIQHVRNIISGRGLN